MKKIFFLISAFIFASVLAISAKQITPAQSRLVAEEVASSSSSLRNDISGLKLIQTIHDESAGLRSETVLYYVYKITDDKGFVIISGDDCFYPVIGYSLENPYKTDNVPSNFRLWMQDVESSISKAIRENKQPTERTVKAWNAYLNGNSNSLRSSQAVSPLIQTQWDQYAPYNNECSEVIGATVVTGCVATTMAQIMNYHKYPSNGISAIPGYTSTTKGYQIPGISLPEMTYNWSLLQNTYASDATGASADEIAKLMFHCGVSVEMDYDKNGSGAVTQYAISSLASYFGYDKGANYKLRQYYSDNEWKAIMKSELDQSRPVIYAGQNNSGAGHAFICDGYDDSGLFHFNFGWSGSNDGAYSIDGIPYPYYSEMAMGIQKDKGGSFPFEIVIGPNQDKYIFPNILSKTTQINQNENFIVQASFWNTGLGDFSGNIGFVLLKPDYTFVESIASVGQNLKSTILTALKDFTCKVSTNVPDGSYIIKAAVLPSGSSTWQTINAEKGYVGELPLQVGSGSSTVSVTGVSLNETAKTLSPNQEFQLTATVLPANATNKNVTWNSSNQSVATVSGSGLVKALAVGTTTITVTTEDGGKTATCAITVATPTISVTGVNLDKTNETLAPGVELQLTATILPTTATNKNITWTSSNQSVATVNSSGLVKALTEGTITITVTTEDGGKTATCIITVEIPTVSVTGVSLNETAKTLSPDQEFQLTATVLPTTATNKNVIWDSSDKSVATVSSNGLVKALAEGTTTITITTEDGGKTATCAITVEIPTISVTGVSLNETAKTLSPDQEFQLTATVLPTTATNKNVIWDSSDKSVATVSSNGLVKALAEGTTTITVTTEDGGKTATCAITVEIPTISVTGISLDKTNETLAPEVELQLTATVLPTNATNKNVTWNSSNQAVATVSSSGLVKALTEGTTTITVTTEDGGKTATCVITVEIPTIPVTGVSLDKTNETLTSGDELQLTATVLPTNATNKNITWDSSDKSVATVSSNGLVKALAKGTATITVKTEEGNKTASCIVTIEDPKIPKEITVKGDEPAGADGFGTIIISIQYASNMLFEGSFALTFPDGMEVDLQKTTLSEILKSDYNLTITASSNRSWLFEISPKTLKQSSDILPYEEIVKIVYKITEDIKDGTYNADVTDFDFSFEDGDHVSINDLKFDLTVDHSYLNIQHPESDAIVYLRNNNELYIHTPFTETISIYTIVGSRIYLSEKPAGEWIINTGKSSGSLWIVKGSSGWIRKILVK